MDERHLHILRLALEELRQTGLEGRTLEAFELYALRGTAIGEVASRLSMSADDIYAAKYRISRRLRPIAARLDELYEDL